MIIYPVVLCGGAGTRLWPLSRKDFPKQFSKFFGDQSLFQQTLMRFDSPIFAPPTIVSSAHYEHILREQLAGFSTSRLLIEPAGRNTAPAILAATLLQPDPNALILAAPSDHRIANSESFQAAIEAAIPRALEGDFITFGIAPTSPETGYGYLELQNPLHGDGPHKILNFIEKPVLSEAKRMLEQKNYLWNAGIFLFRAQSLIEACKLHAPELLQLVQASLAQATQHDGTTLLPLESWSHVPDISLDFAIMEHTSNISVMPYHGAWSDMGGWETVCHEAPTPPSENVIALGCENTLLRSESPEVELVGIGLKDIVAIATPDAVLVAHRSETQAVKAAVAQMAAKGKTQASSFPLTHRPWGSYERLGAGTRFQVKRLIVKPKAALSLQSHHHRAEHWIIVEGTALVTLEGKRQLLSENQSIYVPIGAIHRLENPGKISLVLIEVQTGAYLGEDDIERYEDLLPDAARSVALQDRS